MKDLTKKHNELIKAIANLMDDIKFPSGKVATYRVVIAKGRGKGNYDFYGEELIQGHHEFPYIRFTKRKDLLLLQVTDEDIKRLKDSIE